MKKKLVITRAPEGAGVEDFAARAARKQDVVLSYRDYFRSHDGHLLMDVVKIPEAHSWLRGMTLSAMNRGYDRIFVCAPNPKIGHILPYINMAQIRGYGVHIVTWLYPFSASKELSEASGVLETTIQKQIEQIAEDVMPSSFDVSLDLLLLLHDESGAVSEEEWRFNGKKYRRSV